MRVLVSTQYLENYRPDEFERPYYKAKWGTEFDITHVPDTQRVWDVVAMVSRLLQSDESAVEFVRSWEVYDTYGPCVDGDDTDSGEPATRMTWDTLASRVYSKERL